MWYEFLVAKGLLPDFLMRFGMWIHFVARRLHEPSSIEQRRQKFNEFLESMKESPIALSTSEANEQHYEVPTEFFDLCLGSRKKYSCCLYENMGWRKGQWADNLDKAEEKMLALTCERVKIKDGERVLDLGCGWGSFCLYAAEKFPNCEIVAVSNSNTQRKYIQKTATSKNLTNIEVITADINHLGLEDLDLDESEKFDRVVSIEMFEHMRNYETLLKKISSFCKPGGTLFVHIFAYKGFPYYMKEKTSSGFMAKYFFTEGLMPSDDMLLHFPEHFFLIDSWRVNGRHYFKTCMAWLKNMERNKAKVLPLFEKTYGKDNGKKWYRFWRVFYLSCAQMFHFARGNRWFVAHYLFQNRGTKDQ